MSRHRSGLDNDEVTEAPRTTREKLKAWRNKASLPVFRSAWAVLLISLAASVLAWRAVIGFTDVRSETELKDRLLEFVDQIENEVASYEQALDGGAVLLAADAPPSEHALRRYYRAVRGKSRGREFSSIGYLPQLNNEGRDARQGEREAVHSRTAANLAFIEWIVPPVLEDRQGWVTRAIEKSTRHYLQRAVAMAGYSGKTVVSEVFVTAGDARSANSARFYMATPVYKDAQVLRQAPGKEPRIVKGYLFSLLTVDRLIHGQPANSDGRSAISLPISISRSGPQGNNVEVFKSDPQTSVATSRFKASVPIEIFGPSFNVTSSSTRGFEDAIDYGLGWLTLFAGVLGSMLIACLVASASLRQAMERKAKEQQALLATELSHRIKNNLAVVQSIARRTLKDERSIEDARELLIGRLETLSNMHASLIENSWRWVSLKELAVNELQPFATRVSMSGPPVRLSASPAQMFALVVHELATNAAKYGALSVPEGLVEINWAIGGSDARKTLSFDWKERGGPEVTQPITKGFGQTILQQALVPGAIQQPELVFETDGLRYVFEVPLSALCEEQPDH